MVLTCRCTARKFVDQQTAEKLFKKKLSKHKIEATLRHRNVMKNANICPHNATGWSFSSVFCRGSAVSLSLLA